MLGLPLARLVKPRALKVAWLLYPLIVTFVVVSTGNHWWLDAFLGALTAAFSAYVADRLLARARPHAWAFGAARAEAPA
jgi:membrane-associated phospholipid phosphatase